MPPSRVTEWCADAYSTTEKLSSLRIEAGECDPLYMVATTTACASADRLNIGRYSALTRDFTR